jgi:prephenate dehydrogenase
MPKTLKPRITIIGGYGGMGKFFAELFAREGFQVVISGPSEASGREVATKLDVEYVRDNSKAVNNADVVMVSVPINSTLDVIKEVAPKVRKGSLLMDVTSVKEKPCEFMDKFSDEGVEVIGTHPIFSHRVGSLEGQVFVLTPVRGKKWLSWLKKFLKKHKARVFESTPREHDEVMAVVQGLTHFAYISVGKTLDKLDFDIKESRKFSSPVYELMLDMIGRVLGQNPGLYASIQMQNPRTSRIHEVFLEVASELSDSVRKRDEKKFIRVMKEAARHFDDVERAMGRSDKAIYSLVSELDYLKDSVGKELCLKHIYSGTIHLGVVKSVTPETVTLNDNGKVSVLKISNIQILDDDERIRHKEEILGTVKRDFSMILDDNVDEGFIQGLLKNYTVNILDVAVKDVYRGEQIGVGEKSVCFRLELIDCDVKKTEKQIKEFFKGIGGRLR